MLLIRWLLDPMHIEVNVCKNVLKHIHGANDSIAVRDDAKQEGMVKACWIGADGSVPAALRVLPDNVIKRINGMLSAMRFPTGYGAGFRGCTSAEETSLPIGLKSHDYHKLMQHILPVVLQCCDDS
ncbi:unnamed protein product [Calypogeia fissa]